MSKHVWLTKPTPVTTNNSIYSHPVVISDGKVVEALWHERPVYPVG